MSYRPFHPLRVLVATSTVSLLFFACGGEAPVDPIETATPTPTPTQPGTIDPSSDNLEKYAKITASPADNLSDNNFKWYEGINVADGYVGNAGADGQGVSAGVIWRVPTTSITGSSVKFEWNSNVVPNLVKIWDNPKADHQIMGGTIRFNDSDEGKVTFNRLPDDGGVGSPLIVTVPSNPIRSLTVTVTSHLGTDAGIAEIQIAGYRVDEAIPLGNITPYMRVAPFEDIPGEATTPTVLNRLASSFDNGTYRTARVKDGKTNSGEWKSAGLGTSSKIVLKADRNYSITKITLFDLLSPTACRFKDAFIDFRNTNITKNITKLASESSKVLNLSEPVVTDKIVITLHVVELGSDDDKNCGLTEVEIQGSYTP